MAQLTVNEAGTSGYTHVISLSFDDLAKIKLGTNPFNGETLGTAGQLPVASIPAGGAVELAGVLESTALAGATDITLDVGTTAGDPDEFIDALDVDAMSAPVFNTGDAFTGNQSQPVGGTNTATSILLEVTDAAIASATAGKIVIGLRIVDLGQFA